MNRRQVLLSAAIIGLFSLPTGAADWPQWRGPQRNGISQETGLLKEWPKEGPKLVWQANHLGEGYSTPAVVGERLFVMGNHGMDDEFVQALDTTNGKPVWSFHVGSVGVNYGPQYPGARGTPTIDVDLVYTLGSNGDLVCLDGKAGKSRWHKNLRTDFGGKPGRWAYSESPLVDGDMVVCTPGGSGATLVALKKETGDVVWKSAVPDGDQAAYASVIVVEAAGIKQYVQFLEKGMVGVDAKTGKFLWRYDRPAQGSPANIPTPVAHENEIFCSTGRGGGGLVALKADNGSIKAEQVYFKQKLNFNVGGMIELGGYLYGANSQGMTCAEFSTGNVKWQKRGVGPGAVCYADGCLYVHGEGGAVALIEATPQDYHEKGRFTPAHPADRRGKGKAWAYPVVADGRLYIRDGESLWSYDVRGQVAAK